jgi:hypothetical protein
MPLGRSRKTRWTEIKWDTRLLVYADDVLVNLLGDNIDAIKKNI